MHGYLGRILRVDLSRGRLWDEALNEDYARRYVGGSGLAARYLYDVLDADTDPLGPENPLLFLTGPLVGTSMTSAGRYSVCARSPLTGIWGEANSGGFFGPSCATRVTTACGSAAPPGSRSGCPSSMGRPSCTAPRPVGQRHLRHAGPPARMPGRAEGARGLHRAGRRASGQAGRHRQRPRPFRRPHRPGRGDGLQEPQGHRRARHRQGPAVRARRSSRRSPTRCWLLFKEDMPSQSMRAFGTAGYLNLTHMLGDLPIRYFQLGEHPAGGRPFRRRHGGEVPAAQHGLPQVRDRLRARNARPGATAMTRSMGRSTKHSGRSARC